MCPEKFLPSKDKKICEEEDLKIYLILSLVAGGVIVILLFVVALLCCCKNTDAEKLKDAHK